MCNVCKRAYDIRNLMKEKLYMLEICTNLAILPPLIHLKRSRDRVLGEAQRRPPPTKLLHYWFPTCSEMHYLTN